MATGPARTQSSISRRGLMAGGLAVGVAGLATGSAHGTTSKRRPVILVHGAWHGGWCWRNVAAALRQAGHRVFTPSLTGLGDRAHLVHPGITVDTHVDDIVTLIEAEELEQVVLVGHSYGGVIITAAADRLADRISGRVYLDALVPRDGESLLSGTDPAAIQAARDSLIDGYLMPSWPPEAFGITPDMTDAHAWLTRRLRPMPWGCFSSPLTLSGNADRLPASYIACTAGQRLAATVQGEARAVEQGWPLYRLDTGHDAMITMPDAVASLLLEIAG